MVIFDADDIDYLVIHLSSDQLRREIHNADVKRGVALCFGEDVFYWEDFKRACELALDIQRANQPKVSKGQFSVKDVKESQDIVEVIGRYTKLRKAGKEYIGKCPFHAENHPSLQVNPDKQLFYCFSCQRKGDVISFVSQIENLNIKETCKLLKEVTLEKEV